VGDRRRRRQPHVRGADRRDPVVLGLHPFGALGNGIDVSQQNSPVQVGAATTWTTVAVDRQTCAGQTDGTLWCWGWNSFGQLGDGTTAPVNVPEQVGAGASTWATIAVGYLHTCALQTDHTLWCWGYDGYGELGDGTSWITTPTPISS